MLRSVVSSVKRSGATLSSLQGAAPALTQARFLNLHEYQSKGLLEKFGVNIQPYRDARTPEEAKAGALALAAENGVERFVIKAQVHAGGRGKGTFDNGFQGGVHLVDTAEEVEDLASKMLGNNLITKQTTASGVPVTKVMVAEAMEIEKEYYFAILLDRAYGGPVMIASTEGGVDIETVAEETPDLILKEPIDIRLGITSASTSRLAAGLGFTGEQAKIVEDQMRRLYTLFIQVDATQVEINPLATTPTGEVLCFDAKISFDDNAAFRQKEIFDMQDPAEEDARELKAAENDMSYIAMDGNIGCMVNGAGLAMATMDIIKSYGGEPANFLDVGGSATEEAVANAFEILTSDAQVEALLINIFGGIMKCDVIAQGVVNAAKKVELKVPLVVRLAGTNVERGREILDASGLDITSAEDLDDAAQKAVAALNA